MRRCPAIAGAIESAMFGVSVSSALRFEEEVDADETQKACITEGLRVNAITTIRPVRAVPNETFRY